MGILILFYILIFAIFFLIALAVAQIKLAGMNVKDFWSFIEANQVLDKLYIFAKKYQKLDVKEQLIFLKEAERVFEAFDKVPNVLWEEDYQKYIEVLNTYKDIKMLRWASNWCIDVRSKILDVRKRENNLVIYLKNNRDRFINLSLLFQFYINCI